MTPDLDWQTIWRAPNQVVSRRTPEEALKVYHEEVIVPLMEELEELRQRVAGIESDQEARDYMEGENG